MFQLMKDEGPGFASALVQQMVVPILGLLAELLTANVPRVFTFGMPNPTLENLWSTLIVLAVSFGAALIARRSAPRWSRDGRWIWVIPLGLLMWALISDSTKFGFKTTAVDYFNPQIGEAGWIFVFLVIPTYGCMAYSFGVSATFSRLLALATSVSKPQM